MKLPGPYGDTKVGSPSYSDTGAVAHAYAKTAPEPSGWGRDWPHPTAKDKPEDAPLFDLLADWVPDEKARRSLDYAVGPLQERGRDREAEGPGGSQVDHQLELGRLLNGEVDDPGAPQDAVDIHAAFRYSSDAFTVYAIRPPASVTGSGNG